MTRIGSSESVPVFSTTAKVFPAGPSFVREALAPFPDVDQVIPQISRGDKGTVTIGLDATLLATLAKAIGTDGKVVLTFKSSPRTPKLHGLPPT